MTIIKWKPKVYDFTVAWPIILSGLVILLGLSLPLISGVRELFGTK
jgi:hypothetical protein